MSTPTDSDDRDLDGRWYCPTCDDAHDGECPAVTPPGPFDRLLDAMRTRLRGGL